MRSLAFKFTLALILVSLLGIAIVAVYASQIARREFSRFLFRQDQGQLTASLEDLYRSRGSWTGFTSREVRSLTGGVPRSLAVADENGYVVIPSPMHPAGTYLSPKERSLGQPIEVDGRIVGTVFSAATRVNPIAPIVAGFSRTINQSLWIGGLIAVAASLVVGIFFSLTLTRRLGELSKAAQAIAQGELDRKVRITSKDEIGDLAHSFNQMSTELERSRELRRQMTADIAHELRTPLSVILGRAETLAEGTLPPTQEVFQIIHEEARRVNRLVEDLRTLSLSDSGELSLQKRPVPIQGLLEDMVRVHKGSAEQKGILLQFDGADNLPSILADKDRLKQVLDNLISNAMRYTPQGGVIQLSAASDGKGVAIRVKDTGSGIPEDEIPYLFDRFYRSRKTGEHDKAGSGLGLAIAKSLTSAHGGRISVSNPPGAGATFTVWFPAS